MFNRLLLAALALVAVGFVPAAEAQRAGERWVRLASKDVDLRAGEDTIEATGAKGSYRALRIENKGSQIELSRVRVAYSDQSVHLEERRINLLKGERTRMIDQRTNNKFVDSITLTFNPQSRATQTTRIEVWGLQNATGAAASRPATGNIPVTPTTPTERISDHLLGVQTVEPARTDRDVIRLGEKYGRFDRVRLKVLETDLDLIEMRAVYTNGEAEVLAYNANIPANTKTRPLTLKGERSIQEIQFTYRTKARFRGRATVEVWGEYAEGYARTGGPQGWLHLGTDTAGFLVDRRDTVPVGRNQGNFRQLRVETNHTITLFGLQVIYDNGETESLAVPSSRARVDPGVPFGPLDLKGSRAIREIRPSYRTRIFTGQGLRRAVVEFWGRRG